MALRPRPRQKRETGASDDTGEEVDVMAVEAVEIEEPIPHWTGRLCQSKHKVGVNPA